MSAARRAGRQRRSNCYRRAIWLYHRRKCLQLGNDALPEFAIGGATVIPLVFSGTSDGHLRGYSTKDGAIIWDVDTAQPIHTVNGGQKKGGTLDGAGPTVANGILYTNSGYGRIIGQPGNLLLAFSVDGK